MECVKLSPIGLVPRIALVALVSGLLGMDAAQALSDVCRQPDLNQRLSRGYPGDYKVSKPPRKFRQGQEPEKRVTTITIAGRKRPLKFDRYPAITQPSRGTVIYLCGGPGAPCAHAGPPKNLPPDVDVLTFDYLGIGENGGLSTPTIELAIQSQAMATLQLAKNLKLRNYSLYGHSFGTTVATVAGSYIERDARMARPKSIVLEGVVGEMSRTDRSRDMDRIAEMTWQRLTPRERDMFAGQMQALREEDGRVAEQAKGILLYSAIGGPKFQRSMIRKFIGLEPPLESPPMPMQMDPAGVRLYRAAGCQIDDRPQSKARRSSYFGGIIEDEVRKQPVEICDCPLIKDKFDPSNFEVYETPLVYVNGTVDPATPLREAKAHFNAQPTPNKIFLEVADGGHGEMLKGPLTPCSNLVFDTALSGDLQRLARYKPILDRGQCPGGGSEGVTRRIVRPIN